MGLFWFHGGELWATHSDPSFCLRFIAKLSQVPALSTTPWDFSPLLHPLSLRELSSEVRKARVRAIVDAALDSRGQLINRLRQRASEGAGSELMRQYFRAYHILIYGSGYQEVVVKADRYLPNVGTILDLGSGPGLFASALLESSPDRRFILVDHAESVPFARQNLALVAEEGSLNEHWFIGGYLGRMTQTTFPKAQAGLVNHVLYFLPRQHQRYLIKTLFDSVESGAVVVINEPMAPRAGTEQKRVNWFVEQVDIALTNGAPQTEQDLGLLAGLVFGRATAMSPASLGIEQPMWSEEQWVSLVEDAGFHLESKDTTYDGYSIFMVLRKP